MFHFICCSHSRDDDTFNVHSISSVQYSVPYELVGQRYSRVACIMMPCRTTHLMLQKCYLERHRDMGIKPGKIHMSLPKRRGGYLLLSKHWRRGGA